MEQKRYGARYYRQKELDPILDHPDWLRVSSARQIHNIREQLQNIEDPIEETNERLAGIEGHSEKMSELLIQAAISNEKGTRLALRVGIIAIIIAIVMPAFQIAYNEFWRVPRETQAKQIVISDLKAEIANLKQQHVQTLEGISDAIVNKEKDTVNILKDIKTILDDTSNNLPERRK